MSIEFRVGDLFEQDLPALAHGVNCSGVMGAGIAAQFRRRWPRMYLLYRQSCKDGRLEPGLMLPYWTGGSKPAAVYNLATQDRPGPRARLAWIREAVGEMMQHAEDHHISAVGVPQLGAGIGGLDWASVSEELVNAAMDSPVCLVVVTLPMGVRRA